MLSYIARRLGSLAVTMLIVTIILFVLMHSVPGGPFELKFEKQPLPDYVLENMLDPSAIVAKDYQVTVLATSDGRIITGIIKQESDKAWAAVDMRLSGSEGIFHAVCHSN